MAFKHWQGSNKANHKGAQKGNVKGSINKNKSHQKTDKKRAKAAAPTADDLDSELMKYMGNEFVAKKLDGELDEYFKASDAA